MRPKSWPGGVPFAGPFASGQQTLAGGVAIRKPHQTRTNRDIRAPEVRLIAEDGTQLGIVGIQEALQRAEAAELDLVEVAPDADPPVCKIFDHKKVLYEKKKKLKDSKKKASVIHLKEIKLRVAIDQHDRSFKLKRAREFLEKGDKIKFTIVFRGREITRPELGHKLIRIIREELADIGEIEQEPTKMGRQINMIMGRRKDWQPSQKGKDEQKPDDHQAEAGAEEQEEARQSN